MNTADSLSPAGPPLPQRKKRVHWPSVAQLAFSLLATMTMWGGGVGMLALRFTGRAMQGNVSPQLLWNMAAGYFMLGLVFLPSAAYAFFRLSGRRPVSVWPGGRVYRAGAWLAPVLFLASLGLGATGMRGAPGMRLLMPLAHLVAAITPVWWWLRLGSTRLHVTQSGQRRWGLVSAGLGIGPFLSMLIEITLVLGAVGAAALWATQNPQAGGALESMGKRLLFTAGNPAATRRALKHILETYPLLRLAGLTAFGVFVPLVEEVCKPLGVWVLSRKNISPQEGLLSGMISGGMFALLESTLSRAQGDTWLVTMAGRGGTSLMHIATAGLVGYALARAWRERRYLHLAGAYLLAVLLHGAWNVGVINIAGSMFLNDNTLQWNPGTIANGVMLSVVLFICLWIVLRLGGNKPQVSPLPVDEETANGLAQNTD